MANTQKKLYVFHEYEEGAIKSENFNCSNNLDTAMSSDTAQAVINWARNFVESISENDYGYTRIEEKISINEILAED